MRDMEYLQEKRLKVLNRIRPICEAFGITNYDYEVNGESYSEVLMINHICINCALNSITAIVDELTAYIFLNNFAKNRSLGAFEHQLRKQIMGSWITEVAE